MDDNALYQEEQLQTQKEIKKALEGSAIIPLPKFPDEMKAKIVNEVSAKVVGEITVNDTPFKALSSELQAQIAGLINHVTKTIADNAHEPLSEISVKNIKDAKADEVLIRNIDVFADEVGRLVKAIIDNKPVINLEKQVVKFPNSSKDYVSVRLTNGKQFYEAVTKGGGATLMPQPNTDPTIGYQIADEDSASTTKYYGFTNSSGAWYILCNNSTAKTYRYATGSPKPEQGGGLYTDAWINRANLTYGYFYEVW